MQCLARAGKCRGREESGPAPADPCACRAKKPSPSSMAVNAKPVKPAPISHRNSRRLPEQVVRRVPSMPGGKSGRADLSPKRYLAARVGFQTRDKKTALSPDNCDALGESAAARITHRGDSMRNPCSRNGTPFLRADQAIFLGLLIVALLALVTSPGWWRERRKLVAASARPQVPHVPPSLSMVQAGPAAGEPAPEARFLRLDDGRSLTLTDCLSHSKPVVLIFGSYS